MKLKNAAHKTGDLVAMVALKKMSYGFAVSPKNSEPNSKTFFTYDVPGGSVRVMNGTTLDKALAESDSFVRKTMERIRRDGGQSSK